MEYSVLMSVYYKEKPENLRQAMASIRGQSVPTDDFLLVCDGPLTDGLDAVIREQQSLFGDVLRVLRLPENVGLGRALNAGLGECRHELVARMDSDDISRPDRCEKQLAVFAAQPGLSIVSGTVEEFSVSPEKVEARRVLPETQEEILRFAAKRNPFNHPCVMYRRSAVEEAGGYMDFYLLEDYFLWIRMLASGMQGRNLPDPLLFMRAGSEMYRRRSGRKYAASQKKLLQYMRETSFITRGQYWEGLIVRTLSAWAPNGLRKSLYKLLIRK